MLAKSKTRLMEKSGWLNMYLKRNIILVGKYLRFDMLIPIALGGK